MRGLGIQRWALRLLTIGAVAAGGCVGIGAGADTSDQTGTGGSGAGGCQTIGCVPKVVNTLTFAAVVTPPVGSDAALTEMVSLRVGGANPINLVTDAQSSVTATFSAASGSTVPGNANIVLDVASQIPGRPVLSFQAPANVGVSSTGGPMTTAQLAVPQTLLQGSGGMLSLLPLAPDDQQTPPYTFSVSLNPQLPVQQLPSDNVSVSGKLVSSVNGSLNTTFVARAFQGAALVSNAPLISPTDGNFKLFIPSAMAATSTSVTIQLTPQSQTDPWFIFTGFQFTTPLAPISLARDSHAGAVR